MAPPARSRLSGRVLHLVCLVLGIFLTLQALIMAVAITCTDLQWQWPLALIIVSLTLSGIALIGSTVRGAIGGRAAPIVRVPWPDEEQAGGEGGERSGRDPS